MLKSCPYCGRLHPSGYVCPRKPRYDRPRSGKAARFRRTEAWRRKREEILARDYHLCRICNGGKYGRYPPDGRPLQVHHIEPLEEAYALRLEADNLLTCCARHHKRAEAGGIPRDYLHGLTQVPPRWDVT